jgi:hypothetical protein
MSWRLMGNLQVIKDDIDRAYRPRPTIYTVGDAKHAATTSDHNPHDYGFGTVVAAIDVMFPPSRQNIERALMLVQACIHRMDLSYVIYNRRIWSAVRLWHPIAYNGTNPHTDHVHISARHSAQADLNRAHLIFKRKVI